MFKKLLFLSILVILNFRRTNAQSWLKAFGDFAPGSGPGMALETYDMGFLICTETGKPFYNGLLIKTDINGNVLWQKQCDSFLRISRMLSLKDGSIILGGDMYENDSSSYAYVMKLDDCGNPVWGTRLNYCCSYNEVFCLQENIDGDILASCDNYGDQPSILFCFDNKGKFKWKYADNMTIFDILPNINGDILVSGDTYTNDSNLDSNVKIIHSMVTFLDSSGKKTWSDIYGHNPPYKYGGKGIGFNSNDKGFLTVHTNFDPGYLSEGNNYMVKFDSSGKRVWVHYWGDSTIYEWYNGGVALKDSTFILVGGAEELTFSKLRLRITKVNSFGKVLASKDFLEDSSGNGITIRPTSDGKFIVSSRARINGYSCNAILKIDTALNLDTFYTHSTIKYDYLCPNKIPDDTLRFPSNYTLVRVDTMLRAGVKPIWQNPDDLEVKIYPNPFSIQTNISYNLTKPEFVKIEVMDITGRMVAILVNSDEPDGINTAEFNPERYSSSTAGIFILRISIGASCLYKQIMFVK